MRRHTDRDGVLAAGDGIRYARITFEYERQRTGPKFFGQHMRGRRNVARPVGELHRVCDMHDQRMVGGPALGGVDLAHGIGIRGIGTEAVDSFCGECDEFPGFEDGGGVGDVGLWDGMLHVASISQGNKNINKNKYL